MSFFRNLRKLSPRKYNHFNKEILINQISYNITKITLSDSGWGHFRPLTKRETSNKIFNNENNNENNIEFYKSINFQREIDIFRESIIPGEENIYLCLFNDINSKEKYNSQVIENKFICAVWQRLYKTYDLKIKAPFNIGKNSDKGYDIMNINKNYYPIIHKISCKPSKYLYLLPIYKNRELKDETFLDFVNFWIKARNNYYRTYHDEINMFNYKTGLTANNEKILLNKFNDEVGLVIENLTYITSKNPL